MSFSYRKLLSRGLIFVLLALLLIGSGIALRYIWLKPSSQSQLSAFPFFQKGMVYANWSKEGYLSFASDDSLKELARTNTEWVALTVTWYQDKYNSTEIKPTHRSPSDESLLHAIRKIRDLGMSIMLKPQLDISDTSEGKWRGEIEFNNPADWQLWFDNYRDFIVHYVEIANAENIEIFCLGTELTSSTLNHPEEWRKLISHIRDIYKGYLTYAANWYEEFANIAFWDLLDYAGVDPYFPLTETKTPSVEELKRAWQPWVRQLEEWQEKIKKPVIFTEVGYKACEGTADNPWEHLPRGKLDIQTQANCYQALFETFFYKKWLWGIYWWYWQVSINPRLSLTRGFPARGKPAEEILTKWYSRPDPRIKKAGKPKVLKKGLGNKYNSFSVAVATDAEAAISTTKVTTSSSDSPDTSAVTAATPAPTATATNTATTTATTTKTSGASVSNPGKTDSTQKVPVKTSDFPLWQKGMCYVTWNKDSFKNISSDESLSQLKSLGVEWVSLSPTWYQEKYNSLAIQPNTKTPSDESLIHAIKKIHELGMKVMLKPHLDLLDQSGGRWRGQIEFGSDQDWDSWFKSYSDFILHYAKMAKDEGVEIYCIGTELTCPAVSQPDRWRQLIKEIRNIYCGRLTYAANWYDEYFKIEFWDLLDYVGLDPYFPLIEKDRPSFEEIKASWKLWEGLLEEWQAKIKKPVIFPEVGYKSSTGTTDQPWLAMPGKEVDLELQRDCYLALLEIFWNKPWFYGIYWWYWGTHPKMGGKFDRGFTPKNKPAQDVIKDWYYKPAPRS